MDTFNTYLMKYSIFLIFLLGLVTKASSQGLLNTLSGLNVDNMVFESEFV